MITTSLCMIARDEDKVLARCLHSIKGVGGILPPTEVAAFKRLKPAMPPEADAAMKQNETALDDMGMPSFFDSRERLIKRARFCMERARAQIPRHLRLGAEKRNHLPRKTRKRGPFPRGPSPSTIPCSRAGYSPGHVYYMRKLRGHDRNE